GELASLMTEIRSVVPASLQPTFFEVGTAMGFLHFVRRRVEVAVIEVGLGGRFDSTNVCEPICSIITSISHDHTQILGDTITRIAFEKAGIIKPGRPVISGATAPEAREVIERVAEEHGSKLLQLERDFSFEYEPGHEQHPRVKTRTPSRQWPT